MATAEELIAQGYSIAGGSAATAPDVTALLESGYKVSAPSASSGDDYNTMENLASGVVRGVPQIAGALADLAMYLPKKAYELGAGEKLSSKNKLDKLQASKAVAQQLEDVEFLQRRNSLAQRIGENIIPVSKSNVLLQLLQGVGAGTGAYAGEKYFPDSPAAQVATSLLGGLAPTVFASKPVLNVFAPGLAGKREAQTMAQEFRKIVPDALTEGGQDVAERSAVIAQGLEASGEAARKQAGALFKALPENPVILDDAITNISNFAEQVAGPITPGSRTANLINQLKALKPDDVVTQTPASLIVDEAGKPLIPAVTSIKPGGPAKLPLNKVQDALRDIGKLQRGAEGVDVAILGRAKDEVLAAAEKFAPESSFAALKQARDAWRDMSTTFDEGAVGAVRDSFKDANGKLLTLQRKLTQDPKSAQQLASVMSPDELVNAQHVMLADLFTKAPVTWEKAITKQYGSYKAIFGPEGTERLLNLVSREGSVGKKLLQDNAGLQSLLAKTASKAAIGGLVGYEAGGGIKGTIAGMLTGLAMGRQGNANAVAKSLIMRAAAGSPEALRLLSQPASKVGYNAAIKAIQSSLLGTAAAAEREPKSSGVLDIFSPQKKTPEPALSDAMPTKEEVALVEEQIDADPYYSALYEAESGRNPEAQPKDPKTGKLLSSAKGGFQFINSTAKAMGLDDPFDLAKSFKAVQALTEDHRGRFGDTPKALYRAHVLGAPLAKKVLDKSPLTDKEQDLVNYFNDKAWPNFERRYNRIMKAQTRGSGLEEI